jgi:hypothetical protein
MASHPSSRLVAAALAKAGGLALRSFSGGGGIAQLGERLLCKQEVVGSIPSASTIIDAWPGHAHRASRRLRGVDRSLTSFIGRGLKV